MVSSTPRPHFTPGKDPVPILQEAGWAPGPVWTGGKSRPYRDSIPDRPASSQSLYRLSYPAHNFLMILRKIIKKKPDLANSLVAAVSEPALYRLLTFQVPNLMSLFRCLGRTIVTVQFRGSGKQFVTGQVFMVRSC